MSNQRELTDMSYKLYRGHLYRLTVALQQSRAYSREVGKVDRGPDWV